LGDDAAVAKSLAAGFDPILVLQIGFIHLIHFNTSDNALIVLASLQFLVPQNHILGARARSKSLP